MAMHIIGKRPPRAVEDLGARCFVMLHNTHERLQVYERKLHIPWLEHVLE